MVLILLGLLLFLMRVLEQLISNGILFLDDALFLLLDHFIELFRGFVLFSKPHLSETYDLFVITFNKNSLTITVLICPPVLILTSLILESLGLRLCELLVALEIFRVRLLLESPLLELRPLLLLADLLIVVVMLVVHVVPIGLVVGLLLLLRPV